MFGLSSLRAQGRKSARKPDAAEIEAAAIAARARLEDRLASVRSIGRARPENILRPHARDHERATVWRVATAVLSTEKAVTCRVADQSFSGFRLTFENETDLPAEFGLTIPTLQFVGLVRLVWRNGTQAGVSIVQWSQCGR